MAQVRQHTEPTKSQYALADKSAALRSARRDLHVVARGRHANRGAGAERGERRPPLPVGLAHDDAGDVVIAPDAEVQAAVRDVFAAFAACGSAYGVVAAFSGRRFPLRAYGGAGARGPRGGRPPPPPGVRGF